MKRAFWRNDKRLSWNEEVMLDKCLDAHRQATFRENLSSQVITAAFSGNGGDFLKAVASGLGTTGGLHAPIDDTFDLLDQFNPSCISYQHYVLHGDKMPGWGSAFVKGKPDPIVEHAMLYLDTGWPDMGKKIEYLTDVLHGQGKNIYPNMACLTAATALILQMPKELAPVLFLQGRAMAWAEIIYDAQRQAPKDQVRDNRGGV